MACACRTSKVRSIESPSPPRFFAGEKVPKADEGAFARNSPHPHFVSPSPRKKTRGEGLSNATGILRDTTVGREPRYVVALYRTAGLPAG